MILTDTLNILVFYKNIENIHILFPPGAMINPQWLELPISRTNFHGPKDVRVTEVRLFGG